MQRHSLTKDFEFLMRNDLMTFVIRMFAELYPSTEFVDSPHLAILCAKLQACQAGRCKRLIINLPPRSLKSIVASVAFPAWVLGKEPHKQIICVSYGQELAEKHSRDCRTIMTRAAYENVFSTRLSPQKLSVNDFMTTAGGFRMATSVGGVLTGRGSDIIIIDDPLKPSDAYSEPLRKFANDWCDNTARSRLNDKENGVIIVVMQRLHEDDLVGHLLEKEQWEVVRFPAIAQEDEVHEAETPFGPIVFKRTAGEVLDPRRDTLRALEQLRNSMGDYVFEAQYQQDPQPASGAIIKTAWLRYFKVEDRPQNFTYVIQSWDTANKSGELNDYSVCTTWGAINESIYLLDVYRRRLEYPDLRRAVQDLYERYRPRVVLIEDRGSGTQLVQDLGRRISRLRPYLPPSGGDKLMRAVAQSAAFENGAVLLPNTAHWLSEYVRELTSFPGSKHDDQIDSTTQALDYWSTSRGYHGSITELLI